MKVHLIGIGGVGMAGLAVLLKAQGHAVSGCDVSATARTKWLETNGIPVSIGHDPAHVADMDEVVVTPAVDRGNAELLAASGLRIRSRGEVLAELVAARDSIAVCGSHGKTTTATWTARLLKALGEDVAWCIGGETGDFPVAGTGEGPLVVEADESDGTLALYRPKTLVVNRCEYDHPDHFPDKASYFACFDQARQNAENVVDSETLAELPELTALACFAALPAHNRKNARAAVEVALRRGHTLDAVLQALPAVVADLPDRRFQVVCRSPVVVTDYAHHPTEMKCAVEMARAICRGKLRVLFQPHRYSRTRALLDDFPPAFEGADEVVLCPTYAAFEHPVEGGDIADLYAACRSYQSLKPSISSLQPSTSNLAHQTFFLSRSCEEAWEHARNSMAEGDVTLLLGAGDIIRLVSRVQADLAAGSGRVGEPRKIWLGAGSNTWKSDLSLSVDYVKTEGPAGQPGASLGIPWMAGIPGTIGGWLKMNAGAFGHSIGEAVLRVKVDGRWLTASECGFGYRHSELHGEIQDAVFKPELLHGSAEAAASFLARRKRFPAHTWGSFFKNPPGDFAGRLLESVGAKDLRVGGAYVWGEHANVIVAGEGTVPSDVLALARLMRERVRLRLGVVLEPEVCGIEFGAD